MQVLHKLIKGILGLGHAALLLGEHKSLCPHALGSLWAGRKGGARLTGLGGPRLLSPSSLAPICFASPAARAERAVHAVLRFPAPRTSAKPPPTGCYPPINSLQLPLFQRTQHAAHAVLPLSMLRTLRSRAPAGQQGHHEHAAAGGALRRVRLPQPQDREGERGSFCLLGNRNNFPVTVAC